MPEIATCWHSKNHSVPTHTSKYAAGNWSSRSWGWGVGFGSSHRLFLRFGGYAGAGWLLFIDLPAVKHHFGTFPKISLQVLNFRNRSQSPDGFVLPSSPSGPCSALIADTHSLISRVIFPSIPNP